VSLLLALALTAAPVEAVAWQVPQGYLMQRPTAGPDGTTIAFLAPHLWCGTGAGREFFENRRIATFGRDGRLLWDAKAPGIHVLNDVLVQSNGGVLIWGWHVERVPGSAPRASILVRLGRSGLDSSFHPLTLYDLGGMSITSVSLAADDSIEIEGTFAAVRGQARPGRARLGPDGSLEN
jgi:hypothetical protein